MDKNLPLKKIKIKNKTMDEAGSWYNKELEDMKNHLAAYYAYPRAQ